jgi:hemerythrin
MPIMEWREDYSVGVSTMDYLHKQLVTMINHLYEAMQQSKGEEVVKEILSSLVQCIKYHLSAEEKILRKSNFPGFAAHLAIHQELTMQVLEVMDKIKHGKIVLTVKIIILLRDWLINHIAEQDKQYG